MRASDISRALAVRINSLALDLLPSGHREGHEWRVGSLAGEPGKSLGIHLAGDKAGVWSDFSTGEAGDALDLVGAVLGVDPGAAIAWSRRWLGIEAGTAEIPRRIVQPKRADPEPDPDRWRAPWERAVPIAGTLADRYLAGRGLAFDDPEGAVLRFAAWRARRSPDGDFERHPALLALLSDARTGEPVGTINIFLQADGSDRVRDAKGKTVAGRARGAVVMLDDFAEVTMGLCVCEGVETALAIQQTGLRPVWACGSASTMPSFPVLAGIEALTIAADADPPGQQAAEALARRWRDAGREVAIIAPPSGDWADPS
jgi:Toprim domain